MSKMGQKEKGIALLTFCCFDRLTLVAISINGRDEVATVAKSRERERMLIVQCGGMKC